MKQKSFHFTGNCFTRKIMDSAFSQHPTNLNLKKLRGFNNAQWVICGKTTVLLNLTFFNKMTHLSYVLTVDNVNTKHVWKPV